MGENICFNPETPVWCRVYDGEGDPERELRDRMII